jgi:hypothetical protein
VHSASLAQATLSSLAGLDRRRILVYFARVWDSDPQDPRARPEPPASPSLQATFKWEQTDDDGEDIGPLIVFSPEDSEVVWESSEWMRLSEAQTLAAQKQWQFTQDGSSNRVEEPDEALQEAIRQADAESVALKTEEGLRSYFGVSPEEETPDLVRRMLHAIEQQSQGKQSG